jgi:hypothetical protein
LHIDHVILGVGDLDLAARRVFDQHGLESVAGGRHLGLGTGNKVIPLGRAYIELMGVVDSDEAAESALGRWIQRLTHGGDRLVGWCIATTDIDSVARRLGLDTVSMQRRRPDGVLLSWRLAGLDAAMEDPLLPFFISWEIPDEDHPGRVPVSHRVPATGIASIEIAGDSGRLAKWLGGDELPVRFVAGEPGLKSVHIASTPPITLC